MDEYGQNLNLVIDNTILENTKIDVNYENYKTLFNKRWKDKFYKYVTIDNYGSGQHGSRIRNAVTGHRYPYLVGSPDEALLFKVTDATGRNRRKESLVLYYDSPEQFENHHFIILNQGIKDKWYEKNINARRKYVKD